MNAVAPTFPVGEAQGAIDTDVLVVGAGIAGLQASLDLADQGYRVLLVEREASVGGHMIALSKVFPTMDCSSCITTPKMSSAAHHDLVTMFTYTDVHSLAPVADGFDATIVRRPRYVDRGRMHRVPALRVRVPGRCAP